jgi:WD40 repeat protein
LAQSGTLQMVTTADMATVWEVSFELDIRGVIFSPNSQWIVIGSGLPTGQVVVLESDTGSIVVEWEANRYSVEALAFSPDGMQLATGGGLSPTRFGGDYDLKIWNTQTWQEITPFRMRGQGLIRTIDYSP